MNRAFVRTLDNPSLPRILLIEMPPRCGKTEFWSKWAASWFLGTYPDRRLIMTTHGSRFAKKYGREVRNILAQTGEGYFGLTLRRDNRSASEWSIEGRDGSMVSVGAGADIIGRGSDCLIADDVTRNYAAAKSAVQRENIWDWWHSVITTRMQPNGIIVVISTRWHEEDLSGRLLKEAKEGSGRPVTRLRFPALAEDGDILGRQPGESLWPSMWSVK